MTATPTLTPADTDAIEEIGPPPRSNRTWLVRIISIVVVMAAWEYGGRQVNPLFMSYPSAIARAAWELTANGELPKAIGQSMFTLLAGYVSASIFGIVAGLLIGRYRDVEASTDWIVNALYATPLVAVVPLVVLWFGLGWEAKLFIVFKITLFPVLINTAAGVRNVPAQMIELGNAFCANERQIFTKIILPSAMPYMMTGLRLGIGRALIGMVVAEFFTAITGLGAMIVKYGNQYETDKMFVPILVLMLLGIALTVGVKRLEDWIAPWKNQNND
ncbi:ABC transporter permease [Paenirhodobacter populi]|uniref:ABC transporter permease n=1 Tax=Paenirhodobacter populi TaxID=2306993 RepID=A0A443K5M9_9RHOB|nr:ABC transporter permease [Sinirhodobacter populi]RWR06884.1 ABC transporter permease [Sinirhodobacter populi]RWR28046.1 ABC transporter permease [Sinirhodobacter populi]